MVTLLLAEAAELAVLSCFAGHSRSAGPELAETDALHLSVTLVRLCRGVWSRAGTLTQVPAPRHHHHRSPDR